MICEQILWLIKHYGLNFQVRETPFSLDINLKKRFSNLWDKRNGDPVSTQETPPLYYCPCEPPQTQDDNCRREMKDPVIEAKDSVIINDWLAECLKHFKARTGT